MFLKKFILAVCLFAIPIKSQAAQALVFSIRAFGYNGTNYTMTYGVVYGGSDVPLNIMQVGLTSTFSSLSVLAAQVATDIRAYAVAQGFTVPANQCFIPGYSAQ